MILQGLKQNKDQTLNPQYLSSKVSYGMPVVKIWAKIHGVTTAPNYIMLPKM